MSCNPIHSKQTVDDGIHISHSIEFVDGAARLAYAATPADVGRISYQQDTQRFYILEDDSPLLWRLLGDTGANLIVKDEGSILPVDKDTMNFIGPGIDATTDGGDPTQANVTITTGIAVGLDSGTVNGAGTADALSRADHTHEISEVGTVSSITPDTAASDGTALGFARKDHIHGIDAGPGVGLDTSSTNSEGVSTDFSRSDHTHEISEVGTISTVNAGDVASDGTALGFARKDHEHAVATATAVTIDADTLNAEGVSTSLARADHTHDLPTATAVEITDSANAEGTSASLSRADHEHAHGDRGGGSLHALATTTTAGFMSASDKMAIDDLVEVKDEGASLGTGFRRLNFVGASVTAAVDGGDPDQVNVTVAATVQATIDVKDEGTLLTTGKDTLNFIGPGITATTDGGDPAQANVTITTASAVGLDTASVNAEGAADTLARSNHTHEISETGTVSTILPDDAAADGAAAGFARKDHKHAIDAATAVDISDSTNSEGASTSFSRADHVHAHGDRGGGSLHALATTVVAGFMSPADKTKLDGVETGATKETFRQELVTTQAISAGDVTLTDTLNFTPKSAESVLLFLEGVQMVQGAGQDYTISGTSITWLHSTGTAPTMKTTHRLVAYYVS